MYKNACIQVDKSHYFKCYDTRSRFSSYWHQIDEVLNTGSSSVLEIGVGNKTVSKYLLDHKINITTLDIDKKLFPHVAGSVLSLPYHDNIFDTTLCCEVLEHLPYHFFISALKEIKRVTKQNVILSLPDVENYIKLELKVSYLKIIQSIINIPINKKNHKFDGQHYWEIGKHGYNKTKIANDIRASGLLICSSYRNFDEPYHRFFICKKGE